MTSNSPAPLLPWPTPLMESFPLMHDFEFATHYRLAYEAAITRLHYACEALKDIAGGWTIHMQPHRYVNDENMAFDAAKALVVIGPLPPLPDLPPHPGEGE